MIKCWQHFCVCVRARALVACATQFSRFTFLVIINTNIIKLYFINNYKMWFHLIKLVVKGALIRSIFNLYTHCKHRERDANLSDILSHPLRLSAWLARLACAFPTHSIYWYFQFTLESWKYNLQFSDNQRLDLRFCIWRHTFRQYTLKIIVMHYLRKK